MKRIFLNLVIVTVLIQANCTNDVELDPHQDLYGYYNFTIGYATFDWGYGYYLNTKSSIGKVEKFTGIDDNNDNLMNKIGILLDTADVQMIIARSCYDSSLFRYVNYYHPSIDDQGELNYPEFLCHSDYSITQFEGIFINDSLEFTSLFGDTISATRYRVIGGKIN